VSEDAAVSPVEDHLLSFSSEDSDWTHTHTNHSHQPIRKWNLCLSDGLTHTTAT